MRHCRLWLIIPILALPGLASAQQGQKQAGGQPAILTAASIAGTWVGGLTDSTGALLNDQANSDTLVVKADSSYKWTRTVDSERTLMLDAEHAARSFNLVGSLQITNLQVETKHTWKQLTDTTISWMGNRDYKLKLDGDKLTMVSKVYLAFTRTSK